MQTIEVKFKIVTPMFISGADQTRAELRVPPIKGALRFWWRALNYEENPKELLKEEGAIFGSSEQEVGQSKVKMRLKDVKIEYTRVQRKWNVNDWESYIGYGLSEDQSSNKSKIFREFIEPGGEFSIVLNSKEKIDAVVGPMKCLSLLGGLGSRSRKGWGSIAVTNTNIDWPIPDTREKCKEQLGELIVLRDGIPQGLPKYSAVSSETDIRIGPIFHDPNEAFKDIGTRYKDYLKRLKLEERDGFGLPRSKKMTRRGSPLMIHVHQCKEGSFWVCLFLKSYFNDQDKEPSGRGYEPVQEFLTSIGGDMI